MNTEQMREAFEAWAISRRFAVDRDKYLHGAPYTSVWTTGAWEAWQAALATQPQAPQGAVTGWQPIETAPKDGTSVLLFTADGQIEAYWDGTCWEQAPCYATYDGCGGVALTCRPTHWQPLLAAPETPEGKK